MTKLSRVWATAVVLLLCVSCARAPVWNTIRGPGFVGGLPGNPKHTEEAPEYPFTRAETWSSFAVETENMAALGYVIRHALLGPAAVSELRDSPHARDEFINRWNAPTPGATDVRLAPVVIRMGDEAWPGREIDGAVPNEDARARLRVYLVRDHFYSLLMVYRPTASVDAEYKRMTEGFKLVPE